MTIMAMLFGIAIFYARPAYQGTTRVVQPDGSGVTIRLVGDEYLHYNITLDGYSLVRRDDGAYVYAQMNETGQLEATDLLAHDAVERTAKERDYLDQHREVSPLVQAEDAILLDNSNLTIEEQNEWLMEQYKLKIDD